MGKEYHRRWGILAHNKKRKRQKEKRRRRAMELWATGQFSRKEIAVLCKVSYPTICDDIIAGLAGMEEQGNCFLCGQPVTTFLNRRVASRTAAAHRRLADMLDGGGTGDTHRQ